MKCVIILFPFLKVTKLKMLQKIKLKLRNILIRDVVTLTVIQVTE